MVGVVSVEVAIFEKVVRLCACLVGKGIMLRGCLVSWTDKGGSV